MPLLRVRAAVAEPQLLSQNREMAVRSPLSSSGLFNSVSVGAAKNPAAPRAVCPTASVPALTSTASTSLSFVFLTPPAAPARSRAPFQCGSRTLQGSGFQTGRARRIPRLTSQSALTWVPVCESARSPVQVATVSQCPSALAPSPFLLSSNICARIHSSLLRTSILSAGNVHLYKSRCIFLHLRLIPWVFRMVWYLSSSTQGTS